MFFLTFSCISVRVLLIYHAECDGLLPRPSFFCPTHETNSFPVFSISFGIFCSTTLAVMNSLGL